VTRRAHPRAAREWTDAELPRIAAVVRSVAGLVVPDHRREAVEQGIRRVMRQCGLPDLAALREAVASPGAARDALLAELTIGETYFFREPAQLEVIGREVLPAVAAARAAAGRPPGVRIWSAACASGEEPYSLAILLRERGWSAPAELLGTDVALPRLAAARRGRYSRWALRATPPEARERWFEARGGQYLLRRQIRDMVRFAPLNLASDDYPSPATGTTEMDVVLCRNVLIYFDAETVAAIARRLLAALAPWGWLFVGASDPPLADIVPCEVVVTDAGLAYRATGADRGPRTEEGFDPGWRTEEGFDRGWRIEEAADRGPTIEEDHDRGWRIEEAADRGSTIEEDHDRAPRIEEARGELPTPLPPSSILDRMEGAYAAADYERAAALARGRIDGDPDDERAHVLLVRSLANLGRLPEAGLACAAALDRCRTAAELHYLHATLLAQGGRFADAAGAARRALYLDRTLAVAHLTLGDALARAGDARGARLALGNAESLLSALPADAAVPAADGETAGRLRELARFRRRRLIDATG
jgi:chemotaxis protein methyltransferase CheR